MAVIGIHHLLVETHDWRTSLAFWRQLGWELVEDHGTSGKLTAAGGGPYIWLNLVDQTRTPVVEVYFDLDGSAFAPKPPVEIVEPLGATHWGTALMSVRDPDGRIVRLQAT
jgi:catechol 2,3-dioxygenase-like lactoylglutathione lyase family enzyme